MNPTTLKIVKLPDDRIALEVETINYGGSETYPTYTYYYQGKQIIGHDFETSYWGRIEFLTELDTNLDLTTTFKALSRQINS